MKEFLARILLLFAAVALQVAAEPVTEWEVTWTDGRPRDPGVDSTGKVWFCGQGGGYLGRLDPGTGKFDKFDLGAEKGPHNLIIDARDQVWYAGNTTGHIGRLDPATGRITRFPMPDAAAQDPHTLIWDRDGNIWFTVQHGNFLGHLNVSTGKVRLVPVQSPHARPYGIVVDAGNRPWAVLFGSNRLATVDPATLAMQEISLPRSDARPRRLVVTTQGDVWYGDYAGGVLGRYRPADGSFKEWPLPRGTGALPYGMAVDDQDRIWLAETGVSPNRLVEFDPATEKFLASFSIPSGGGVIRHLIFDPATRAIWFGADTGTIGRLLVP